MLNSHGQECILAFTPMDATSGWTMLGFVPAEDLSVDKENWLLFGVVSVGLLILFIIDMFYMLSLNKRLQITASEAESANKAKTDFLSTMSHDIRTPMNAIIGFTAIAEKNLEDVESTRENLRKISLASNHLLTLINDILDISKVESGKLKLSPLTFSIVETVENLVNISQPMVKEKNLDFSFHISRMENEYLYTDQLRLNQIYINILSNAIKYTEPGGKVSVDMAEEKSSAPGSVRLIYAVTAPELSALLDKELPGVETLTLNFKECEYISSAGLRVLLATHKSMKASGGVMQLTDVGEVFLDVLENTGLDGVFKIV